MKTLADFLPQAARFIEQQHAGRAQRARVNGIIAQVRRDRGGRPRRQPPEAGMRIPAIPPRGPVPLIGGAEAPLEFDD